MPKTVKLKDKIKKKDSDALKVLLPVLTEYMVVIMPAYRQASPGHKLYLRAHNPILDEILKLTEV